MAGCGADERRSPFPEARRGTAPVVADGFSTEDARDRAGEADTVMALAGVEPGMSVADIGAGEGYYAVRLARAVGRRGRVLAEDIVPEVRDRLALRVQREGLDQVAVRLGKPENPMLPAASFDRIFLAHVYHEVAQPYEFLWHLAGALRPGGRVVVVEWERPVARHGFPRALLTCEFAALGLEPVAAAGADSGLGAYVLSFEQRAPRPHPGAIRPCAATPDDEAAAAPARAA